MLVLSGPEKAGKTTLLQAIEEAWPGVDGAGSVTRRAWHHRDRDPKDLRDTRNLRALVEDIELAKDPQHLVIWDRSWVCESVYGILLGRKSDLADNPFLGEWLYGRAIQAVGMRAIMLPADPRELEKRRSADDLQVHPALEYRAYKDHALKFGYEILENDYTEERLQDLTASIVDDLWNLRRFRPVPPGYAGPFNAKTVVITESREVNPKLGEWLPASTPDGLDFAETLGPEIALSIGWATARQCPPNLLRKVDTLVVLGEEAILWAVHNVGHDNVVSLTSSLKTSRGRAKAAEVVKDAINGYTK